MIRNWRIVILCENHLVGIIIGVEIHMYVSSFRLLSIEDLRIVETFFLHKHCADIGIGKTTEKTEFNDFKLMDKYFLQLDNSLGTRNCVDS